MKKLPFLLLIVSLSGCAFAEMDQYDNPIALENRTLYISDKVPGFEHPYWECTKKRPILGGCAKKELRVDYYDLTDPKVKEKLKNMGFVAVVREKRRMP